MSFHAFLPPSGAGEWVHCPMWPRMNAMYPKTPTDETREGDAAHYALFQLWREGNLLTAQDTDPTGHPITKEMLFDVIPIAKILHRESRGADAVFAEDYLPCPSVHETHNGGSPDAGFVFHASKTIALHDFKYGFESVEAVENWQCLNYVCAILDQTEEDRSDWKIVIYIHQPRDFSRHGAPLKVWEVPTGAIRAYRNRLHSAAAKAMEEKPAFKAGSHCFHCPGRAVCPANQKAALGLGQTALLADPHELTSVDMGREYAFLKQVESLVVSRRKALEDTLVSRFNRGERGFGWSVDTSGQSALKWAVPVEKVLHLGEMVGKDLKKPQEALTPTQAIQAGVDPTMVKKYAKRLPAKPVLVPSNQTMAAKAFAANPVQTKE